MLLHLYKNIYMASRAWILLGLGNILLTKYTIKYATIYMVIHRSMVLPLPSSTPISSYVVLYGFSDVSITA